MVTPAHRGPVAAALPVGGLVLLACLTYGRLFDIRPLEGDNLYALSWAGRTAVRHLLRVDPNIYPEWRPLAYLTVWLQYLLVGVDHIWSYFLANLLMWIAAASMLHHIINRAARSNLAAFVAAALFLTDTRATWAVAWIIERQSIMAVLFGVSAMCLVLRIGDRPARAQESVAMHALLLASALSKEYGLAFACAIAVFGVCERRPELTVGSLAAGAVYGVLRVVFAGGAVGEPQIGGVGSMVYNIAATAAGTVFPGLLDGIGHIGISPRTCVASAVCFALALVGARRGSPTARLALLLVASNALVSFMIYRSRNQLVGLVGFQILMGIGLAETHTAILPRLRRWTVPVVTGAFVLIVLITGGQMRRTRLTLASEAALGLSSDPCAVIHDTDRFDPELIRRLKAHYEMANPGCVHRP